MFFELIYVICFIALIIGTYTDIKTREVPDWLNFSMIASGLGIRLVYSVIEADKSYIVNGITGLVFFVIIAYAMFYAGQWGGGDSKMLMGLGALLGLEFRADAFLFTLMINILIVGAAYGLLWSFGIVIKNGKKFMARYKEIIKRRIYRKEQRIMLLSLILLLLLMIFIEPRLVKVAILALMTMIFMTFYLWIAIKVVEKVAMYKHISPEKLTEGDWIAKDIIVGGKYIAGPKDLGIEKKQIQKLIRLKEQNKISRVMIKEGIPFVPSFLLAFVVSLQYGNFILNLLI